ncbi:MAG: hypothetical protein JJT96_20450 [Opitutales bacterium]|nr:hypothetical protein [Opitutales bacterium]
MNLRLITLRYEEGQRAFPEEALTAACAGQEVLEAREHWNNNPENCRVANRNRNRPDNQWNNNGFRLASTPSQHAKWSHPRRPASASPSACGPHMPPPPPAPVASRTPGRGAWERRSSAAVGAGARACRGYALPRLKRGAAPRGPSLSNSVDFTLTTDSS